MKIDLNDPHLKGKMLPIYKYPHPVLLKRAEEVTEFNDDLVQLCQDMLHTLYHAPGVGLAAPQIGKALRVFVVDVDYKREMVVNSDGEEEIVLSNFNPHIFINPIISADGTNTITHEEGCLSLPGIYEDVTRPDSVTVEYQDLNGDKQSESFSEIGAVCVQHENDHLNGTVFIDHLSLIKKNFIKKRLLKQKRAE